MKHKVQAAKIHPISLALSLSLSGFRYRYFFRYVIIARFVVFHMINISIGDRNCE